MLKSYKWKKTMRDAGSYLVRLLVGLLIMFPIIMGFSYSLRSDAEIMTSTLTLFPKHFTWENYVWVLKYVPVARYMLNSIICCAIVIGSQALICSMAAYAFSFFDFKGKKLLFMMILMTTMIPGDVTLIANYLRIQKWGLINTFAGMTLPFLVSGMGIFMMRQFYLSLPKDIKESATLDGCGDIGFFIRIAIPLSVPSLAALAIYEFIMIYNQYLWPLLISSSQNMYTIQIGMAMLKGAETDHLGVILAGAMICIAPAILVFVAGQKYIIRGMISGGIKG
ncbi:MAG TPA: carbohydrate ABC transporter permease [Clostridiaceae bacterium]|jgi:sn-glycerol 3-phosphate transport system permease protein|nr:carbohydrate ABC transporter permease [Clostridiaceae bacterium]